MSDKEYAFTVFTATFNRAHTLHRAYESLKTQSFRNFEWIIVDDGSTDGTEAIVNKWQEEADFPIRYFWQEHGGKHFVFNRGVREARGEYFAPIDSDNAAIPETLERLHYYWEQIPEAQRKRYYVIHTFCMNEHGNMIGNFFEQNPFDYSLRKFTFSGRHHEMWPCFRTDVIKQFPFREDIRGYYIAETTVWHEMDKKYQARFVNDVLSIYYQDVPSITRQPRHPMQNLVGVRIAILYVLNNDLDFFPDQPFYFLRAAMNFARFSFHYNISLFKQYASLSNFFAKFLWLINLPLAVCVFFFDVFLNKTPRAAEKNKIS